MHCAACTGSLLCRLSIYMLLLIIEPVKAAVVHLNADIVPVKADVVKYVYNISTENH